MWHSKSRTVQLRAILPNLNYHDIHDVSQNGGPNGGLNGGLNGGPDIENLIIELISSNNKITTKEMSEKLGISLRTLQRKTSECDKIKYVGNGKNGHWEVIE